MSYDERKPFPVPRDLRDEFAMHAPDAVRDPSAMTLETLAERIANWAYIYADAMMKRRLQLPKEES